VSEEINQFNTWLKRRLKSCLKIDCLFNSLN